MIMLVLSHLITSHTAETGTHYIAATKQYMEMFWKASGGGIIVGSYFIKMMFSCFKVAVHILYSFNSIMLFF